LNVYQFVKTRTAEKHRHDITEDRMSSDRDMLSNRVRFIHSFIYLLTCLVIAITRTNVDHDKRIGGVADLRCISDCEYTTS